MEGQYDDAIPAIDEAWEASADWSEDNIILFRCLMQCHWPIKTDYLNKFLDTSKDYYGNNLGGFWKDVLWVASYCYEMEDVKQASALMKKAIKGAKQASCTFDNQREKDLFFVMYYDLYARIESKYGSTTRSISALKKSCQLKRELYGDTSIEYIDGLVQIANAYADYSQPQKAIKYHNEALTALSENVKAAFRMKDELQREQYWASVLPYFEGTLDAVFFSKALGRRQQAISEAAYNAILLSKAALLSASEQKEGYDYVTISDIITRMEPEDVCIEFFRTRTGNYGALLMKKEWNAPRLVRLDRAFPFQGHKESLDAAIPYTPPFEDNEDYLEFLQALGQTVWPRALTKWFPTKGTGRVYFATAGKLDLCPIECLPLSQSSGQYVEQAYDIYRLSSTRELVVQGKGAPLSHVALIGGINYQMDSTQAARSALAVAKEVSRQAPFIRLRDEEYERMLLNGEVEHDDVFPPLPGTLIEVCQIDSLLSHQADMLTGEFALREGLISIAAQSSTLVLSTHGFSLEKEQEKEKADPSFRDPLSLCGVLLAGYDTADGPQSKYLLARQIVGEDLSSIKLAVLASCNSMGSTLQKDGVYGLMRAFKIAGSAGVIVTMWPIDDRVSNLFISSLFSSMKEDDEDIATSFRKAREITRNKYPGIYLWSPFVLIDGLQ